MSSASVNLIAGLGFLAVVPLEIYQGRVDGLKFFPSISTPAAILSISVVIGTFLVTHYKLIRPLWLVPMASLSALASLGSIFYDYNQSGAACGFSKATAGFPFPWAWHLELHNVIFCPLGPAFLPPSGSSVLAYVVDTLFYLAVALSLVHLSFYVRRLRRLPSLGEVSV